MDINGPNPSNSTLYNGAVGVVGFSIMLSMIRVAITVALHDLLLNDGQVPSTPDIDSLPIALPFRAPRSPRRPRLSARLCPSPGASCVLNQPEVHGSPCGVLNHLANDAMMVLQCIAENIMLLYMLIVAVANFMDEK